MHAFTLCFLTLCSSPGFGIFFSKIIGHGLAVEAVDKMLVLFLDKLLNPGMRRDTKRRRGSDGEIHVGRQVIGKLGTRLNT